MESIMTLDRVGASYDGKPALEDISMEIFPHSITAIIGPSGCGKSTLLRCMNGLLKEESGTAVSGKILLKDQDIAKMEPEELRRRVGLVFQTPSPFPFSIYKNMTYGEISKVLNIDKSSVCERLKNAKRKIKNHIKNG